MRIVNDVNCPMQTAAHRNGDLLTILACSSTAKNHPELPKELFDDEDEVIEIQGEPKYIRKMLEEWLFVIDGMADMMAKRGAHPVVVPEPSPGPSPANEKQPPGTPEGYTPKQFCEVAWGMLDCHDMQTKAVAIAINRAPGSGSIFSVCEFHRDYLKDTQYELERIPQEESPQ